LINISDKYNKRLYFPFPLPFSFVGLSDPSAAVCAYFKLADTATGVVALGVVVALTLSGELSGGTLVGAFTELPDTVDFTINCFDFRKMSR
jgi:hypothetical protein